MFSGQLFSEQTLDDAMRVRGVYQHARNECGQCGARDTAIPWGDPG
jgi:hypothetical protein